MADPVLWLAIAGGVVTILAALTALGNVVRWVWRTARKFGHLVDDLTGEPARPGHDAQPGVMERLATVETRTAQLVPNGGQSIRDVLDRLDGRVELLDQRVQAVERLVVPDRAPTP